MPRALMCAFLISCAPAPAPIPSHAAPVVATADPGEDPTPVASNDSPPSPQTEAAAWPPELGKTPRCSSCLPSAEERCGQKRESCTSAPACVKYLDCVRACPDPGSRSADGGYPQADCVIACKEQAPEAAELGDGYLWCVCCESSCKGACGGECGHFKSGIAGPIGAGCD